MDENNNEMDFQAFLKGNAKPIEDIKMVVSTRFTDANGNPIPWILKQLTGKESNELRKKYTKKIKNKLGRIEEQFNSEGYQEAFITRFNSNKITNKLWCIRCIRFVTKNVVCR